jgi:large subunit ribosomal protein L25
MDPVFLDVESRTQFGKKLGALRRAGITPIHIYGKGAESLSLQVESPSLLRTLAQVGYTTPVTVRVDGDEHFVMVREVQRHPVTARVLHVDLIQVSRTERMAADIPVVVVGEAPAARQQGVLVTQDLHAIQVEALPMDLPSSFTVDISSLIDAGMGIYVRDVELPSAVSLVSDRDAPVIRVMMARAGGEEVPVEGVAGAETLTPEAAGGGQAKENE